MKELTVFEHDHVDVVDSRQVAEMIGKTHAHLMRDIQGYVEILKKSIESKFGFNVNGQWILYKKYMGQGYTDSRTIHITHTDGRPDTKMQTCWTQKGRMMIHNILTGRGIVALMDRERA